MSSLSKDKLRGALKKLRWPKTHSSNSTDEPRVDQSLGPPATAAQTLSSFSASPYSSSATTSDSSSSNSSLNITKNDLTTVGAEAKKYPKLHQALSELPADIKGDIQLGRRIYNGDYSAVWRAEWKSSSENDIQEVVLKVWQTGRTDEDHYVVALRRMVREVQTWRVLNHPHIMPLLGWKLRASGGYWEGPCIVTQFCPRGDLATHIKVNGLPATRYLFRWLDEIGRAVLYLHTLPSPVVHGDISAANVMLEENQSHKVIALLSDFGAARVASVCKTGTSSAGIFRGTEGYKAVEVYNHMYQMDKGHFSMIPASDVYAFGSLMLHVLSGLAPFYKLSNVPAIETKVRDGQTSPKQDHPRIPSDATIWGLMEKCWQTDPTKRPTIREVLKELESERLRYESNLGSYRKVSEIPPIST
ncbi:copper transport protein ctr1 [Tulasnella sp. JGI-2019a]|nr:copper transport protein ctr1 [Tulasnella sp. JGI-2019a]